MSIDSMTIFVSAAKIQFYSLFQKSMLICVHAAEKMYNATLNTHSKNYVPC